MAINIDDVYSKYITSEDLGERGKEGVPVTIAKVEVVHVPDPKDIQAASRDKRDPVMRARIAIHFKGAKRPLLLNKTNAKSIAALLGERDADNWVGKQVVLLVRQVRMGKDITDAIRIKMPQELYDKVSTAMRRKLWEGGPD